MATQTVKERLLSLLTSPNGLEKAILVAGSEGFIVRVIVNGETETLDLLGGNIAILVLTPNELKGVTPGIYIPEV